jgi:predicted amidohydrolase/DNA-binding Lrp family transcriptional regulator
MDTASQKGWMRILKNTKNASLFLLKPDLCGMKICIAQQNYHIGNFEENTNKILRAIEEAKKQGADIILFSEMSVCGYPARDFVEFNDFIEQCYQSIEQIKKAADTIGVLIGSPSRNPEKKGKDLFNAAFFLYEQKIIAEIHKTLLPTYDVFDENRYFESADSWKVVPFKGKKLAITICEDIWNLGDNPLYRICPMDHLMEQAPDIMLNLSASPFDYTHDEDRKATIKANVLKYKIPLFYCNAVGSQTEIVFDGGSYAFDKDANLCGALPMFESDMQIFECNDDGSINAPILEPAARVPNKELNPSKLMPELNIDQVYKALVLGIKDYFNKMGFMEPYEPDAIDWQLLDHLQRDAGVSNVALAEALKLSPPTCLRRVKRLVEGGWIERQVAVLSTDRLAATLGHGLTALVEVSLDKQGSEHLDACEARAVAHDAVQQCWRVSPGPDFMLVLQARDMPHYLAISQALFTQDANVRNVKAFFATKRAKLTMTWPIVTP